MRLANYEQEKLEAFIAIKPIISMAVVVKCFAWALEGFVLPA